MVRDNTRKYLEVIEKMRRLQFELPFGLVGYGRFSFESALLNEFREETLGN